MSLRSLFRIVPALSGCRRLAMFLVALAAGAGLLAGAARAAPITYVMSNATVNFGAGPVTMAGSFTYDPSTGGFGSPDFVVSGGGCACDSTYTAMTVLAPYDLELTNPYGDFTLEFWDYAPSTGLDALFGATFVTFYPFAYGNSYNVGGGAEPAPVPEPTSFSILAAALGLLLIGSRAVRRSDVPLRA